MPEVKEALFARCMSFVMERISGLEEAITSAHEAAANDTKSSAGDKYETTREMMQQEISRNQQQLHEARKLKHALEQINPASASGEVKPGSLAYTSGGNFYLSVSAGQIKLDNGTFFAISPASPVGRALMGLKQGDVAKFNGKNIEILKIA